MASSSSGICRGGGDSALPAAARPAVEHAASAGRCLDCARRLLGRGWFNSSCWYGSNRQHWDRVRQNGTPLRPAALHSTHRVPRDSERLLNQLSAEAALHGETSNCRRQAQPNLGAQDVLVGGLGSSNPNSLPPGSICTLHLAVLLHLSRLAVRLLEVHGLAKHGDLAPIGRVGGFLVGCSPRGSHVVPRVEPRRMPANPRPDREVRGDLHASLHFQLETQGPELLLDCPHSPLSCSKGLTAAGR